MRETGVLVFEAEGMRIALGPAPAPAGGKPPAAPRKHTYEDFLFAASEGLPNEDE